MDNTTKNNKNKTFHLKYQQIVDAFAQYLYDQGLLDNEESEGSLVFDLTEDEGAKIIVTPKSEKVKDKEADYNVKHLDVKPEDKGE